MAAGSDPMSLVIVPLKLPAGDCRRAWKASGQNFPNGMAFVHAAPPNLRARGGVDSSFLQVLGLSTGTIGRS